MMRELFSLAPPLTTKYGYGRYRYGVVNSTDVERVRKLARQRQAETPVPLFFRFSILNKAPESRGAAHFHAHRAAHRWNAALLEHQDGARDLAGLHRAERLVDVLQLAAPADHAVEVQAPLAVVI